MIDVYEFAQRHLYPFKTKGNEILPRLCPYCKGGQHGDQYSFALNTEKQTFNCKRGSCGVSGTFNQLCKDFGEEAYRVENFEIRKQPKKVYKKPGTKITPATKAVEDYLSKRGFLKSTWEKRKVGTDEKGNVVMPYFENGELVLIKFRPSHKPLKGETKSWREEGGKPVFWGMDDCTTDLPLVIVEGEMDALTLDECGIKNVVSVPSGAEDLTCVELCWDWLQRFKKIIIWGDKDEPGQEMVRKLINRLGEYRCYTVQCDRKDANEVLYFDGKQKAIDAVNNAKEVPINGLLRLSDVQAFDYSKVRRVSSGIQYLDKFTGGFMMGQVSVWTGTNSSGKSTLLGQLLIESIDKGFNVCAYSGELPAALFRYWIELQMAGKDNLEKKYDEIKQENVFNVPDIIRAKMRAWYRDRFFLYDSFGSTKDDDVLRVFEYAVKRYNCEVFLIDNLMTTTLSGDDIYRAQSEFIGKIIDFAHKYDVHIHVVAHPRKSQGILRKEDIKGSGDITNRPDNVFCISRINPENKEDKEVKDCDTRLDILKNRFFGKQDVTIGLMFEQQSKRFYLKSEEHGFMKQYGWNKEYEKIDFFSVNEKCPWDGDWDGDKQ